MDKEWGPAGRRFNEPEAQTREKLWDGIVDQIPEGKKRQRAAMREGVIAFQIEKLRQGWGARSRVDADRQVQPFSFLIDREKIGVVERKISFQTTKKHTNRAVFLNGPHFG